MSQPECSACTDLREYAPEFVMNGVTSTVASSLKNDTGLNPRLATLHKNCEDLNDVNDCLIGRKMQELESLDVCDWKEFMSGFGPNLYDTLKAMIQSECGVWERLHALCILYDSILSPPVHGYCVRENPAVADVGYVALKNGMPVVEPIPNSELRPDRANTQLIGISYGDYISVSCATGRCARYVWIAPEMWNFRSTSILREGDVVWYCPKSEWQALTGMREHEWNSWSQSSWTWTNYDLLGARVKVYWTITVSTEGDYKDCIVLIFNGTSYPNNPPGNNIFGQIPPGSHKQYQYDC